MFGISDPQALLRPWRSLTQFTEELYAMLSSQAPVEHEGPVTIRVKPGQTALKLTRGDDEQFSYASPRARLPEPSEVPRPRTEPAPRAVEPRKASVAPEWEGPRAARVPPSSLEVPVPAAAERARAPRREEIRRDSDRRKQAAARKPPEPPRPVQPKAEDRKPLLEIHGPADFTGDEPVRFQEPPKIYDKKRHDYFTPPAWEFPDTNTIPMVGGGGTTVFVGKVDSGTGATYTVHLYQDGPTGEPDADPVTVTVPTIDPTDHINAGSWLYSIFQFQDSEGNDIYSCQPPIWMA